MVKLYFTALLFIVLFSNAQNDKKGNIFSNTGDAAKLFIAKQKLYAGNYTSALTSLKELEKNNPSNAEVKYNMGYCYYALGNYSQAREVLSAGYAADASDIDINLLLGKIYHREGELDKAIERFEVVERAQAGVLSGSKEKIKEAGLYHQQCSTAKTLITSPLKVNISNLGNEINSRYDDKNPCITADGRSLVFTSRRPDSPDAPLDVEGDGKNFENIYTSRLDSVSNNFIKATSAGKPVNTDAHDACTSISPDGKQLFIYKNDVNDRASRGGNVFVSKQLNGKWKAPVSLGKPINTAANWEGGACVSADGKRYFFTSERSGGFGGSDIWMVERKSKKEWGEPVNLGKSVNSSFDEAGMFLAPDGKTLFFCSNGPNSMGSYDVFRTVFENGQWSEPINLGYPINTTAKEGQLTISADARYAYISSDRPGGLGESDVYKIDLNDYAILEKDGKKKTGNGLSILRGTIREGFEGYGVIDVEVMLKDDKGEIVSSTTTGETGEYFITLRSGKYNLIIRKKGYKDISEAIEVPVNEKETPIIEKGYLLKK